MFFKPFDKPPKITVIDCGGKNNNVRIKIETEHSQKEMNVLVMSKDVSTKIQEAKKE